MHGAAVAADIALAVIAFAVLGTLALRRIVVKRDIELPRPRDLELTYTPAFTDIVHELRGHIGAMRKQGAEVAQ